MSGGKNDPASHRKMLSTNGQLCMICIDREVTVCCDIGCYLQHCLIAAM